MDTVLCGFSSMYLGSLDLHLFSRSPADGHEGCCLFGAAVNICVHKFSFPESLEKLVAPATLSLRFHGGAAARSAAVPASVCTGPVRPRLLPLPPPPVTAHFTHPHHLSVSTRPVHRHGLLGASKDVPENRWTIAARPGKGLAEHRGALNLNLERLCSYAEVSLAL